MHTLVQGDWVVGYAAPRRGLELKVLPTEPGPHCICVASVTVRRLPTPNRLCMPVNISSGPHPHRVFPLTPPNFIYILRRKFEREQRAGTHNLRRPEEAAVKSERLGCIGLLGAEGPL
jgi:hypothetical protein